MFRALAVLRVVLIANTVGLTVFRFDNFTHRGLGLTVVAVMVLWTAVAIWAYDDQRRRVPALLVADLAIAFGALVSTPLVKGDGFNATVPGFWIAGALMAWAIHWRWAGALVAATVLSATDLLIRPNITQTNYGHVFLLMIAGPIVGYMCGSLQRMAAERDRAERAAAIAEERARLARAVHDGVLQVLALTQRKAPELGGEGAELGRLAGEQEQALRSLIRQQDTLQTPESAVADLGGVLERLGNRKPPVVSVVTPGVAVDLPQPEVAEITAAVGACLDNVAVHVGEDARAWVLLEDLGDRIVVSVRDEGPGIPEGRLEAADADGRLGVSESIRGRIRDLGGTAELFSTPGTGTEWEFTIPRLPLGSSS
ncbi:histidine kinase [Nocardioides sp. Root151]|nr:histidine kinase [Nocardioides sp. Root140]KQZ69850.1 histidine kinase [Nocardioides sp. Root151]KRF15946.1 histidine kinase [Nocardioides sp. Soil796]